MVSRVAAAFALALLTGVSTAPAVAQTAPPQALVRPGNVVVTGFSGTRLADKAADGAKADADGITIETNGASLRILDVGGVTRPGADPASDATEIAAYNARVIGQVFGITLDDAVDPTTKSPAPNIYATATSAYGLNIVLPPETEGGWPRRTLGGDQAATWMDGQWGQGQAADGTPVAGGPASIWRIDGITGQAALFATIATNGRPTGAPSLGNIAYDPASHEFFVSDLESGLIHRLSLTGQDLGTFDHGVTARQVAKLPVIADDINGRADIKSMHFRADDPNTWGYAAPSRRVWGLNVSAGRLYYAVADGPEIWSVAIKADGDFGDSRREIIVPADQGPFEITDVSFDSKGWIYLAQRPPVTGNYDYLFLAAAAPAKVLRYRPDPATNSWTQVPDEYHIGLTAERRQTDGGVTLGYGYKSDGKIDYGTCDGTLWATGDDLDRSPRKSANIGKSDATDGSAGLNISGLQGSPTDPNALTANTLRFTDYDGILPTAQTRGQIGDVRAFTTCGSPAASATPVPVEQAPEIIDLQVEKIARGDCLLDGICHIEVKIWNRSDRRYFGPLTIAETLDKAGARMVDAGPSRWACGQGGADISCHHPGVDIGAGLSTSIFLDYRLPARWSYADFADCADIAWLGDFGSPRTIVAVEIELARLGLYTGAVDRIAGPQLQGAIEAYTSAHGLAKDGAINAALIETLFGRGSAIPHDRVKLHDRSCAVFHIHQPWTGEVYSPPPPIIEYPVPPILTPPIIVNSCPYGYWNRGGDCVRSCPWGYRAYGDRCFPEGGPVCRGGWLTGGECTCPAGYTGIREQNGRIICRPSPGEPQPCFGGFLEGNRCQCPWGTHLMTNPNGSVSCVRSPVQCNGGSMIDGQCRCPFGEAMRDGRCVPVGTGPQYCPGGGTPVDGHCPPLPRPIVCPPGLQANGNTCVATRPPVTGPVTCPPGYQVEGAACLPPKHLGPTVCPPGYSVNGAYCVPANPPVVLTPVCPVGERVNGKCPSTPPANVTKICPLNEVLINGKCQPGSVGSPQTCPINEELINGKCQRKPVIDAPPVLPKTCPANEELVGGACRPRIITSPVLPKTCPGNEILVNGNCQPKFIGIPPLQKTCPANEVLVGGACRPQIVTHPPVNNINCPAGTVRHGNNCNQIPPRDIHPPVRIQTQTPIVRTPIVRTPIIRTPIVRTPVVRTQTRLPTVQKVIVPSHPVTTQIRHSGAPTCRIVNGKCAR